MKKLIFIPILFVAALAYAQKAAVPEKAEKMVEISVEITEINENKSIELGIKWPNEVSVSEMTIPAIIESGEWARITNYTATLKALETAGAAKVLSKPKLVTKSGSTAKFMVGGEIPIVSTSLNGNSVEWKEYGIIMDITPIIMQDGKIDMKLQTELSRIDYNAPMSGGYYSIAKRQASSHIQIKDGETMVLAGLIETTKGNTREGIPILSDIPILGVLFSVQKKHEDKINVLIFVTTKIME
ncbi:MAG: type II and III secretion system protein [Endomicrobia bacterium]|nr:type II and III secretion system protein [Endomicrobiia bacterium]